MERDSLAILVPVLGRPHRVKPLMDSIQDSTPHPYAVHFLCDPDDIEEIQAVDRDGRGKLHTFQGNYAQKIRAGVEATSAPLLFLGADDLDFHKGWLDAAQAKLKGKVQVVGVNDLCSPRVQRGDHATHFLMTREYAEAPMIDGEPGPLCDAYGHNFVDDELVATARKREAIAFATDSIVEHLHPDNNGAPWDETYRKGRDLIRLDRRLFRRREHLWR